MTTRSIETCKRHLESAHGNVVYAMGQIDEAVDAAIERGTAAIDEAAAIRRILEDAARRIAALARTVVVR